MNVILRRTGALGERTFALADLVLDEAGRRVTRDGHEVALTPTEFCLLAALLRRPGRVLAKSQLLSEVWQYSDGNPNLVEVHVLSLRRKLEIHGPRLIHTVRSAGYVARS